MASLKKQYGGQGSDSEDDFFGGDDIQVDYASMRRMQALVWQPSVASCANPCLAVTLLFAPPRLCTCQLVKLQQQLAAKDKQLAETKEVPELLFKVIPACPVQMHQRLTQSHCRGCACACVWPITPVLVRHVYSGCRKTKAPGWRVSAPPACVVVALPNASPPRSSDPRRCAPLARA